MKTIEFEGKKYEVGDWVRFVAKDSDKIIWAYKYEPYALSTYWYEEDNKWRGTLGFARSSENWRESLIKV